MSAIEEKWVEARKIAGVVIRHFEGDHLNSYVLKGETWATISVGVAIPLSQHPRKITQDVSDKLFAAALFRKEAQLRKEVPAAVLDKLNVGQLVGLLSFRYNMKDTAWLDKRCRTRKFLVAGEFDQFLTMHGKWVNGEAGWLPGLARRRRVEHDLMSGKALVDIQKANWYHGQYR